MISNIRKSINIQFKNVENKMLLLQSVNNKFLTQEAFEVAVGVSGIWMSVPKESRVLFPLRIGRFIFPINVRRKYGLPKFVILLFPYAIRSPCCCGKKDVCICGIILLMVLLFV